MCIEVKFTVAMALNADWTELHFTIPEAPGFHACVFADDFGLEGFTPTYVRTIETRPTAQKIFNYVLSALMGHLAILHESEGGATYTDVEKFKAADMNGAFVYKDISMTTDIYADPILGVNIKVEIV